jgi:DNA-binding NarL/FixJ family response regulator
VRAGDRAVAQAGLQRLAERADASGTELSRGLLARSRALVTDDDAAHAHYREAAERLELAHELFASMGCEAFAERARMELLATGGHARRRDATGAPDGELTPREAQVASRVAAGATNQEIAAQLFIRVSTVDYHLRKVFRKLQVKSRTGLAGVMLAAGRLGDADLPLPR